MNILITGNAGFIGAYLTKKLILLKHNVKGLDINPDNPQSEICECITGDICDRGAVAKVMDGVDMIIDLAAKHHDFGISEKDYFEVNEGGTKNLAECAGRYGVKKFIFFSSVAVFGKHTAPPGEETASNLPSIYGRSKLAGEKILEEWAGEDASREVIIIRPAVVFGPGNLANMYSLIRQIMEKKFIFIGKGDNIKSIAYVKNLVEATTFLMDRSKPGVDRFNYADEPQMTIKQIVDTIARCGGVKIPDIHLPLSVAVILASPFDVLEKISGRLFRITAKRIKKFNTETYFKAEKIRKAGFKQPFTLQEGLRKTVEWFKISTSQRRSSAGKG